MAQASVSVAFYAYISAAWVELDTSHPYRAAWGISDNNPMSRLADIGEFTLALNNSTGQYTVGGPSALAGWKKQLPFKMEITFEGEVQKRWRGYISDIQIKPNNKDKKAYITVVEWLDYAARHPIVNPGIQTDKRGDEVLTTVMSEVEIQPQATDFDTGIETFPTAFDTVTSKTKAYTEFAKTALSEIGMVYEIHDKTYGETIKFENATARHGWIAPGNIPLAAADSGFALNEDGGFALNEDGGFLINNDVSTFTADGSVISDFDAPYGKHVINRATVYANPRRLSASAEILFQLDEEVIIGSGATIAIKGTYADPNGGLPINGQDMITPAVTTDYTMFTATGGGGSNISADLVLTSVDYGTEGFTHQVTNTNASVGYLNKFNCRGTGIFIYNPIEHAATNAVSIAEYGTESETLNQKYKTDLSSGSVFAESVVDEHRQPRTVLNSISFCANSSSSNMMAFLYTEIGDMRYISITEAGIAGNYYIQGIEFTMSGGIIMVKWIVVLALSLQAGLSPLAVEFAGGVATDGINYGYLPAVSGAGVTQRSWSVWMYQDTASPAYPESYALMSTYGDLQGSFMYTRDPLSIYYWSYSSVHGGRWKTPDNSFSLATWNHIVVTFQEGDLTADPVIYINGVSQAITENYTPSGAIQNEVSRELVIGNIKSVGSPYIEAFDGKIFDPRVYNTILTQAQVTTLYNAGVPDETLVTDGLVFQGFNVRTGDLASYIGTTLTSAYTLRENMYGAVGVVNGAPVGRAAP